MRSTYCARPWSCAGLSVCVVAKRNSFAMRSRLAKSSAGPFLHHLAEHVPEFLVVLGLLGGKGVQHVEHALGQRAAHRVHRRALLQDLARDVERQVVGVHHALHEAQVHRQELFRLVHDERALDVELEAARRVAVPQVEGRVRGDVQQRVVLVLAFDTVVAPGQRVLEVVRDVLVELAVFLVADLGLRARPQRRGLVDRLPLGRGVLVLFLLLAARAPSASAPAARCGRSSASRSSAPARRRGTRPPPPSGAAPRWCRARRARRPRR